MNININKTVFCTVSQRVLHNLIFTFSDFQLIESENVSNVDQKLLHERMLLLHEKLYIAPDLLNLPDYKDEAYQTWELNNQKPELNKVYQSVYKSLYGFYSFLYL